MNDGHFCIDNNLVGNAVKPLALNIIPRDWMEDVLLRISGNENIREDRSELLPDKWAR